MSDAAATLPPLLAGLAVWLLLPPRAPTARRAQEHRADARSGPLLPRLRPVFAAIGFLAGWSFVGGPLGVVAGVAGGVAMWVVVGRIEDPRVRRRREQLVADLPMAVDLLGACLASGSSLQGALGLVAQAWGGPVGEELDAIRHRIEIGMDPGVVWREVAADPLLAPLGRAVLRAHESGAPLGAAVHRLAEELREVALAEVEMRARAIEVKTAAPLGVCLLPAFVVLGVVPMVVGIFSTMHFLR